MSIDHPTIRRALLADETIVLSILQEYYDAAHVVVRDDATAVHDYLAGRGALWIAGVGADVIGCIALRPLDGTDACEVKRLYVRPKYRGQGIADALHEALESHARAAGFGWIYLDTTHGMQAAIKFYARHGYQPCERYNDNPQATIFMRKRLR